jgi:hypothetical protein
MTPLLMRAKSRSMPARLKYGAVGAPARWYTILYFQRLSAVFSSRSAALGSTKQVSTLYFTVSFIFVLLVSCEDIFRFHSTAKEIAKCGTPHGLVPLSSSEFVFRSLGEIELIGLRLEPAPVEEQPVATTTATPSTTISNAARVI